MHRLPRGHKGVKGAPVPTQEGGGAGSKHPAPPEAAVGDTRKLHQTAEQPCTFIPVVVSRQRICKGGPTAVAGLQPQVWERLTAPETGFLKLVSVTSALTKQKELGRTLPHAR